MNSTRNTALHLKQISPLLKKNFKQKDFIKRKKIKGVFFISYHLSYNLLSSTYYSFLDSSLKETEAKAAATVSSLLTSRKQCILYSLIRIWLHSKEKFWLWGRYSIPDKNKGYYIMSLLGMTECGHIGESPPTHIQQLFMC